MNHLGSRVALEQKLVFKSAECMNAFEFGVHSAHRDWIRAVPRIYSGAGAVEAGLFAAGAATPWIGAVGAGILGGATVLYGAKQVYEAASSLF